MHYYKNQGCSWAIFAPDRAEMPETVIDDETPAGPVGCAWLGKLCRTATFAAAVAILTMSSSKGQVVRHDSRMYEVFDGTLDARGFPITAARICLAQAAIGRCFFPPEQKPPFGLHAKAVPVAESDTSILTIFTAESPSGVEGKFLVYVGLLQESHGELINLAPKITLSPFAEYGAWSIAQISQTPFLVTADIDWSTGAGKSDLHRYRVTTYGYDGVTGLYKQCDQYLTAPKPKGQVLDSEKAVIAGRLTSTQASHSHTSMAGDSLSRSLHPAAPAFPGLPDLTKPVYLKKGYMVCEDPGSLYGVGQLIYEKIKAGVSQENIAQTLRMLHCTVADQDTRVSVLLPSANEPLEYLREKERQFVSVQWENSDGSIDVAWVMVPALRN